MYKVYEVTSICNVWTERGRFEQFEDAKMFADHLIDHELQFEGARIPYTNEVYGEERQNVMYGTSLAYEPEPYGSKGFFVVKAS